MDQATERDRGSRPEFSVLRVPVARTLGLRKAVLRPYLGEDEPYVLADDHLPTTVAFAAVTPDDEVIAVARITPEPPPFDAARGPSPLDAARGPSPLDAATGPSPFDAAPGQSWRLRGMAARPEVRNMGVGSSVLQGLMRHIAAAGGGLLWCNARLEARGLYERAGMRAWGDVWEEPHIGPHIVMWREISSGASAPDPEAASVPAG